MDGQHFYSGQFPGALLSPTGNTRHSCSARSGYVCTSQRKHRLLLREMWLLPTEIDRPGVKCRHLPMLVQPPPGEVQTQPCGADPPHRSAGVCQGSRIHLQRGCRQLPSREAQAPSESSSCSALEKTGDPVSLSLTVSSSVISKLGWGNRGASSVRSWETPSSSCGSEHTALTCVGVVTLGCSRAVCLLFPALANF